MKEQFAPDKEKAALCIRRMTTADLEQVAALEQDCFSEPWSRQGFADALAAPNTILLVAARQEEIVAYCSLYTAMDEGELVNIAVKQTARQQKNATLLLDVLKEEARQQGIKTLFLEVRESNQAARALYENARFALCGRRKGFYKKPTEDAVLMRCDLIAK